MSWDSVVGDRSDDETEPSVSIGAPTQSGPAGPAATPTFSAPAAPFGVSLPSLNAVVAPPSPPNAPSGFIPPPPPPRPGSVGSVDGDHTVAFERPDRVVDDDALPVIVEATPPSTVVFELAAAGEARVPAPPVSARAATRIHRPVAAAAPAIAVPSTQPDQLLTLPPVVAAAPRAAHARYVPVSATRRKPRKDRSGSIARVGFFFLVVAALASAAVIFGRPYLFPVDWEANALEYAEPVEAARGVSFVEPVLLSSQPTEVHRSMVAYQLLGDPASSLPMWRALGLAAADSTDDTTLQMLISEQAPVLYSSVDGQIYFDVSYIRADRDALITRAMAAASLDQDLGFSTDTAARSLDDAALTDAHVMQQSALVQEIVTNGGTVSSPDMAALAFLPAPLDYRLTAPAVFAELLGPVDDVAPNPLADIGAGGPGPLRARPFQQVPVTSLVGADAAVGEPIVTDRSFWYLSFASHLDAVTAYRLSEGLEGAGLQMFDGPTGRCAVANFTTADVAINAALREGLGAWVAAAAPGLGASVTATPDNDVQLRSCDPAGPYASNANFGVGRQLMAWRAIELAVTDLIVARGGTQEDVTAAIEWVGSTPSAVAVTQLPAGTSPSDLADAAQAAAADVVVVSPSGFTAAGIPPDPAASSDS